MRADIYYGHIFYILYIFVYLYIFFYLYIYSTLLVFTLLRRCVLSNKLLNILASISYSFALISYFYKIYPNFYFFSLGYILIKYNSLSPIYKLFISYLDISYINTFRVRVLLRQSIYNFFFLFLLILVNIIFFNYIGVLESLGTRSLLRKNLVNFLIYSLHQLLAN